jgi:hypothetical protein
MRLTASGRLLVGTTSDDGSSILQIKGPLAITRTTSSETSKISMEGNFIFDAANTYNMVFRHNGGELVRFWSSGNVLIGSTQTDAGYKLDVTGTGRFFLTSTTSPTIRLDYNSSSNYGQHLMDGNGDYVINTPASNGVTSGYLNLKMGGTSALRIASTGAATFSSSVTATTALFNTTTRYNSEIVGIQITDSNSISNVKAALRVSNNGSGYIPKIILTDNNLIDSYITLNPGGTSSTNYLGFGLGNSYNILNVLENGNVGIGTSSPNGKLTLSYSSSLVDGLIFNNTASSGRQWRIGDGSGASAGVFGIYDATAAATRMVIDSNGAVGFSSSVSAQIFTSTGGRGTSFGFRLPDWQIYNTSSGNALAFSNYTTDFLTITSGGNVLVGQTTPDLTLNGWFLASGGGGHTAFNITNNEAFIFNNRTTGTTYQIDFRTNAVERGSISVTDSAVLYNTISDYRLKKDLKDYNGLDLINSIKTYDFQWEVDNSRSYGVMAHELQEVIPYIVKGQKDGAKYQGVDYSKIVPVLIKAIQEQQTQIEQLKNK